ncbi:hypothetical protein M0R45_023368 [Rubus argutus]|uniref:RRM domain-containing protein n=1 Tax=Rubus argutus TaxID=59490 RepID=A0AAW1WN88_RUBAR
MAFSSKFGNILRQIASKQIRSELSPFKLSTHHATRCMSSMGSSKLFIGGISYQTDENSLKEAFAKYGEVLDARIITDRDTGRSRGFGFITYNSSEEASSAIQALDGKDLHGRLVRVNYATEKPCNNFGYGGGDGGYGGGGGGGGYGGGSGGGDYRGGGYSGSGGYGNDSYSSGGTGGNYGGGNSFETGSGGGFGPPGGANDFDFGTGGANNFGVGGESSFSTPGAHFGEDKGGFSHDDPVEGTNRDDDLGYQNRA